MIVKFSIHHGTEIGDLPKGVGTERLRWTGRQLVDLMDLSAMWAKRVGNTFELHAVRVPGSQLVQMSYTERKRLINDNGTYRILTQTEVDDLKAAEAADLLETNNLKAKMIAMVENLNYAQVDTVVENIFENLTTAQKTFLKNLAYISLYFSKREVKRL
jgi:hypothetical protein